jgi:hypothetical protein
MLSLADDITIIVESKEDLTKMLNFMENTEEIQLEFKWQEYQDYDVWKKTSGKDYL